MKTLSFLLLLSLLTNAFLITDSYNKSQLVIIQHERAKQKYEQIIQDLRTQLDGYDNIAINDVFNELFPNATTIDCPAVIPNTRKLLQDSPK